MRQDPYLPAFALLGLVGAAADAALGLLRHLPGLDDVYYGAGIGLFVALDLIVRSEKRKGELPPGRVRQLQRRGALIGAVTGFALFVIFNARALT
jgi:hypothetical protein